MKFKLIVAGAGALLFVGLGIGASAYAAGASVPFLAAAKPTPSPGAACDDFLNHLAGNLGVSQSRLRAALQKSADQTIDDAVAAGKLTAAQAAKVKQRIDKGTLCNFRPGASRPWLGGRPAALLQVMVQAAAETLNLTPQQLMTDIRQGQSISSLAHGMSEAQFRQAFLGHLKTDLDGLVKQGKLTPAQESSMLQRMQTAPIPFWNAAWRIGPRPMQPMTPMSPATGA